MGMKINPPTKGLDNQDNPGNKLHIGGSLEVPQERLDGRPAKSPEKSAIVLKENPQHLRHGEDNLEMRDIQKQGLPHPFAPFLNPLGMARGTETAGAAGKHQQPLISAVRASDAGKSAAVIAAVQIALDNFLDNGSEEAVLLLETALIFSQKAIENDGTTPSRELSAPDVEVSFQLNLGRRTSIPNGFVRYSQRRSKGCIVAVFSGLVDAPKKKTKAGRSRKRPAPWMQGGLEPLDKQRIISVSPLFGRRQNQLDRFIRFQGYPDNQIVTVHTADMT